jgi:hypothetical protein
MPTAMAAFRQTQGQVGQFPAHGIPAILMSGGEQKVNHRSFDVKRAPASRISVVSKPIFGS